MTEWIIPCILDSNKSCIKVDLEIPPADAPDAETVAELTKKHGLTTPQAKFCVDCWKALSELAEVKPN